MRLQGVAAQLNQQALCRMNAMNKALFVLQQRGAHSKLHSKDHFFSVTKRLLLHPDIRSLKAERIEVTWNHTRKKHSLCVIGEL